jgi:hypothetical protein
MHKLLPLFENAGVKAVFSGHEHNFQHSRHSGIDYFISGGAGKIRRSKPSMDGFEDAHTVSWAGAFNFLIVTVDGDRMVVTPFTERDGKPYPLTRVAPDGSIVTGSIDVIAPV